ncbi:MAG TPA: polyphosphate kinase 1 [Flavobacteriaceae bacterium]|nr:polyphosphate kinase 1 [Flavobacteriaceae bacterium]
MKEQITQINDVFYNRELSWLQFNARVLQEAEDATVPLVERLRFVGIFSNNLDEFFRVRYASIKRIVESGGEGRSILGDIDPNLLLEEITNTVIHQQAHSLDILSDIHKELEKHDVYIIDETQVSKPQSKFIKTYFTEHVQPALVTYMLDDLEVFPTLKDNSAYLAVSMMMEDKSRKKEKITYALIEVPRTIDRFVEIPSTDNKHYIIILDDLIRYCIDEIFSIFKYKSIRVHMIKITRDAELDIDSDLNKSFISKIYQGVKERSLGHPVRFVYDKAIDKKTLGYLLKRMNLTETDSLIPGGRYHNRRDYMKFPSLGIKEFLYKKYPALKIPGLSMHGSILKQIDQKDYLLYTPYQSFSYVVRFLREAALDPKVRAIRISIYRLAEISHVASSLINAVKNGKSVTVEIELKARFDEESNIRYAEQMQQEGVRLIFGVKGLKVHCKACVIDRKEGGKIRHYGFISTGNFNEFTAKVYTDYTLFTADQRICKEVIKVFQFFEVNYRVKKYKHLLVSPHYTRNAIIKLIKNEIDNHKKGLPSGIRLKMNSLSDHKLISKLYKASSVGVPIQLIIRGICCLVPGIPNKSDTIEVISIVDKFLEHTRLFIFENNGDPKIYISSADFMTRNLDRRVEISCPIYDEDIKQELIDTFEICWSDNVKARIIDEEQTNTYRQDDNIKVRSQFATYTYYAKKLKV